MFKWRIACGNMVKKVFSLNLCGTQASMQLTYQAGAEGFQGLIWIFWVCWLSPAWYNIDHSQWMSRFDCYQLQLVYLTAEHHSVRCIQHKTLQTIFDSDQSQYLLHMLHKLFFFSFVFWLYFYLSCDNKAYAEMFLLFPSSILKWLHKNSPIW